MAKKELIMPQMGEGVIEATILKWVKTVGDKVSFDDTIVEIATDKVDSEIPSPVDGKIIKINFDENEVVPVGKVIAIIETEGKDDVEHKVDVEKDNISLADETIQAKTNDNPLKIQEKEIAKELKNKLTGSIKKDKGNRIYSPLVKRIAKSENLSMDELASIQGSGKNGRVIRKDIEGYLASRGGIKGTAYSPAVEESISKEIKHESEAPKLSQAISDQGDDIEIIEMDRMRKLIAGYMLESKRIAPHVTSIVEADLTNVFRWRAMNKDAFFQKYNQKLTFTPIFIQAIVKAIKDFPMINVSVDGSKIIVKKKINIGMATALPSGNLIVPVIKNADLLSLAGLAASVNDLSTRARNNELKPDEIQGGTYTLTNLGSFGNLIGTPIINQPEVAIMATGAIRKKPAVLETKDGDVIAIRQMMYLSHAYDHRVVDGYLGGTFVRRVADYLEKFDQHQSI